MSFEPGCRSRANKQSPVWNGIHLIAAVLCLYLPFASRVPCSNAQEPTSPTAAADCFPLATSIDLQRSLDSITAEELWEHVQILASKEYEGRQAGSPGGRKASEYIAEQFKLLKLQPAGENGTYFQSFGKDYRNVLALRQAANTDPAPEVLVIGAHYDHVGIRRGQETEPIMFPGADDNASGVAAVLELAEAVAHQPQPPRRSILFVLWDAEEVGLKGSRHWTANPTIPITQVAGMINLDMLGRLRNNQLLVFGTGSAPGLRRIVSHHNHVPQLDLDFRTKMLTRSDHYPFFQQDIPVLFPWTGLHPQLHRPSDKPELIDKLGMQRVTRLVHRIAWDLANRDPFPSFREAARQEITSNPREPAIDIQPQSSDFVSAWGFSCRRQPAEPGVLVVTEVQADSPAERAHLFPADRIYEIQNRPIDDTQPFDIVLNALDSRCELRVERNGRIISLNLAAPADVPDVGQSLAATAAVTRSDRTCTRRSCTPRFRNRPRSPTIRRLLPGRRHVQRRR